MANSGKVLQVRLQEKIDTLENWLALDTDTTPFKPLAGEKINVKVPTANSEADGESVGYEIITKTGDGSTRFKELPWDSALAADVYDWAKAASKPSYSIGEITGRKELSISGAGTKVVSYDGDTADSLNIVGEGLITVTPDATNNKITIKTTANNYSLPAAGTSLGGVKTGGVATISNGQITAISKATNATTADTAAVCTGNAATATTATTANKTKATLTLKAGNNSKTFNGSTATTFEITAADLNISSPLDFMGTTTTALTDGATTNPIAITGNSSYTAVKGDVVLYGDKEFLYTGSAWEELGNASALADAVTTLGKKTINAGTGLTGGGAISTNPTLALAASGATAGSYGPSANASPAHGKTFSVPYITVDAYGRVTAASTKTITLPADSNTHHVSTTVVSSSASGTSDVTAEQTNPYVNHIENSAVRNSIRFVGGGKTTVKASADGSTITISSTDADTHYTTGITAGTTGTTANSATTNGNTYIKIKDDNTHRGQIKITGSGATRVASDANGVITISSTNTTYNPFTTTAQGLTKASGNNGNILFGDNTWHGATDYIVLCGGSASVNV